MAKELNDAPLALLPVYCPVNTTLRLPGARRRLRFGGATVGGPGLYPVGGRSEETQIQADLLL